MTDDDVLAAIDRARSRNRDSDSDVAVELPGERRDTVLARLERLREQGAITAKPIEAGGEVVRLVRIKRA